jgi:hypothetical protein
MKNEDVIRAFFRNVIASNKNKSLSTDGVSLKSYSTVIAKLEVRDTHDIVYIPDLSKVRRSTSTTRHLNACVRLAIARGIWVKSEVNGERIKSTPIKWP